MIRLENLTKKYGGKVVLNNVTLEIKDGEIFGLIGHNGAGKSTTIKSLVSIIEPSSGEIYVDGENIRDNRLGIKEKIGYVSDNPDMFLKLPAITFWKFIADVHKIPSEKREERLNKLCEIFSLSDNYNETIESFSHGMRQKVFVIAALLSNPKIWILDEPMTGLDPQSSFNLKEMMKEHAKEGNTVLFSTHVLEVAEQLCDRIGILSKGNLIFVGTMNELRERYTGESLEKIYLDMVNPEIEKSELLMDEKEEYDTKKFRTKITETEKTDKQTVETEKTEIDNK